MATVPWTARAYDTLPGSPAGIGVGFAVALLAAFLLGGLLFEGTRDARDFPLAIFHILFAAYAASGYAYAVLAVRRTAAELAGNIEMQPTEHEIRARIGTYPWWALVLVGGAAVLLSIPVTIETTPAGTEPFAWRQWNYEVWWHRLLGPFFWWWGACLFYVITVESLRLSRLSKRLGTIDLFDLQPFQPLVRQGLTNAFLVLGLASVASLFMLESGFATMMVRIWVTSVVFAWIGLMLPLRGVRTRIRATKAAELDWCREALKQSRDTLKRGTGDPRPLADVLAYTERIEAMRHWPFDNPTLVRFALYLLIPLASWTGGAIVELGLDRLLSS